MGVTQNVAGLGALHQQPHQATRALLRKAPLPTTRLEELALFGLLFETAVGGFGRTHDGALRIARVALRRLLPRPAPTERHTAAQIDRAAQFIIDRHARPLNVPALARRAALHETTLRRLFLARFGVSPRLFQMRIRVCRAIHLFAKDTGTVLAVAKAVGYDSEKNFYRAVRRVTGLTPAELREARWSCRWPSCSRLTSREIDSPRACRVQRGAAVARRGRVRRSPSR
jgi:AraC-like DNA-binding protein